MLHLPFVLPYVKYLQVFTFSVNITIAALNTGLHVIYIVDNDL